MLKMQHKVENLSVAPLTTYEKMQNYTEFQNPITNQKFIFQYLKQSFKIFPRYISEISVKWLHMIAVSSSFTHFLKRYFPIQKKNNDFALKVKEFSKFDYTKKSPKC